MKHLNSHESACSTDNGQHAPSYTHACTTQCAFMQDSALGQCCKCTIRNRTNLAISAKRLPSIFCATMSNLSSASVHGPLLIPGSRWLCHLSRSCFAVLCATGRRTMCY